MSREECFVASVGGVGPGEDGADASRTVKVEAMPVGEAVEHHTPVARSVILDADGADPGALAAEAKRAGCLLQGRFVETLMRTFGLAGAGGSFEVDIYYDDECGQVTGRGYSRVRSEVLDKTWHEGKDDLGYPLVHLLIKAGLEQDDTATV